MGRDTDVLTVADLWATRLIKLSTELRVLLDEEETDTGDDTDEER